jgi:phosphopantetheine adenylyltransferase
MSFISSSMVNELEESGVDVSDLVPPSVIEAYKKSK